MEHIETMKEYVRLVKEGYREKAKIALYTAYIQYIFECGPFDNEAAAFASFSAYVNNLKGKILK